MNVTAGIGMVWVRLRHLPLRDTSMCAHSDNGHSEKEGGGGGDKEGALSCPSSHHVWLMCGDSHYPVYFRQTQFHLSSGFLPFTLKQLPVALAATDMCARR